MQTQFTTHRQALAGIGALAFTVVPEKRAFIVNTWKNNMPRTLIVVALSPEFALADARLTHDCDEAEVLDAAGTRVWFWRSPDEAA